MKTKIQASTYIEILILKQKFKLQHILKPQFQKQRLKFREISFQNPNGKVHKFLSLFHTQTQTFTPKTKNSRFNTY
jgi:hypothetical protein